MAASGSASNKRRDAFATGASVLLVVAYCVVLHLLIADRSMPRTTLALALLPWSLAALSICAKHRRYRLLPLIAVVAAVVTGFIASRYGDVLASRVERVVYFENLAFDLLLALVFAITLRPGREALVTRLARAVRGADMTDAIVPYTRAVTAAWAIYFVVLAAISTLLFFTQSREVWSLFVNVLVWPLTVAMFIAEYAVRLRVLRNVNHISLVATMRAFMHRA